MQSIIRTILVAASLSGAAFAHAEVVVENAWVRATVAQQQATGAFMRITSPKDATFVAASSPLTPAVEVHEMAMEGDMMRMRQVQSVDLPAGRTVELKPGGYHIMLMNLKRQVKEGDVVPLTLVFQHRDGSREIREVKAPVRALRHAPDAGSGGGAVQQHGH